MARPPRRGERPTFEPPDDPRRAPAAPPPVPVRPDRDPLRAMAPFFATLAAIGVTALAVWLPLREAQDEALQHYESTGYVDVRPGTTRTWHYVEWRMVSQKRIPWKYYSGASPPPRSFARMLVVLHCRLLGPKAKLRGFDASDYLWGSLTKESFDYELRDEDDRVWSPIASYADHEQMENYRPEKGVDFKIYVDVPASKVDEAMVTVKYDDHRDDLNFTKTSPPRETLLRFVR